MPVHRHTLDAVLPAECRDGAIAIGNFDGVHWGHRALLAETVRLARRARGPAVIVTFDPPPTHVLRPEWARPPLTPIAYRAELLHAAGADQVVVLETTRELLNLAADAFFERLVRGAFRARGLVEGADFRFGRDRTGAVEDLRRWAAEAGIEATIVAPVEVGGAPASSSRVRAALAAGDLVCVQTLTGRMHRLFGAVGEGQRRGRTLGFPTANLVDVANVVPGPGVYAGYAQLGPARHVAAIHVGVPSTFGASAATVEAHLLDFAGDLYGRPLAVDFTHRVRESRTFASADDLVRQIRADVAAVRAVAQRHESSVE